MIRSFRCADTKALSAGWAVPRFQAIERVARRKLRQLEIAQRLEDLRIPRATVWSRCGAIGPASTASTSTTSTGSAFSGRTAARKTLKSLMTTELMTTLPTP